MACNLPTKEFLRLTAHKLPMPTPQSVRDEGMLESYNHQAANVLRPKKECAGRII